MPHNHHTFLKLKKTGNIKSQLKFLFWKTDEKKIKFYLIFFKFKAIKYNKILQRNNSP